MTYVLDRILGRGGAGTVYGAQLHGPGGFVKPVAIKLLREDKVSPEMLGLLRDEARLLGMSRDRALVAVEPPIRVDDRWAVVMEYVDGVSTARLLSTQGPLPAHVVAAVATEVARCLDSLHHQRTPSGRPLALVHRDLKPANLVLTTAGVVKIVDLGIAVASLDLECFDPPDTVVGSRSYMPPERVAGLEGPEGDVFSLGVTMRRLATGDTPLGFGEWRSTPHPDSPLLRALIALATECQAPNAGDRPTMREVERRCQTLLHRFDAPTLHDWCEGAVAEALPTLDERVQARIVCVDPHENRFSLERDDATPEPTAWWRRLVPGS